MNIMRKQIVDLFNNPQTTMFIGLYFSGYEEEGEYKSWDDGDLQEHYLYKNGEIVKDYLE